MLWKGGDQLARREDCMSQGRTIDLVGRVHRLSAVGSRPTLHEGDVVAELHAKNGQSIRCRYLPHANDDNRFDPMLFQLVVKVCVRETALRPGLFDDDVALLRLGLIVKLPAPRIFGTSLTLARGNLCVVCTLPFRVIARFPAGGDRHVLSRNVRQEMEIQKPEDLGVTVLPMAMAAW